MGRIKYPRPLEPGDKVVILSPSSEVKSEFVDGAVEALRSRGLDVEVAPHAIGCADGSFASSLEHRLSDFRSALLDDTVRCIICSRGGFGAVHLLSALDREELFRTPKWLVGFSDISALHALWQSHGVASIHGSMAKYLAQHCADDPYSEMLFNLLMKPQPSAFEVEWEAPAEVSNITGDACGRLAGGNFAVLNGLAATPYDVFPHGDDADDVILFLEDIGEQIYEIDRMLHRLKLSGTLGKIKALLVGNFSDYRPDKNFQTMEEMIRRRLDEWQIESLPVAFGFPCGHEGVNVPLPEGATVKVEIKERKAKLLILEI